MQIVFLTIFAILIITTSNIFADLIMIMIRGGKNGEE